jgi:large subunit ribosomal protein L22
MAPRDAMDVLRHMPQKGAGLVLKVVKSATANAENNFELDPAEMYISSIYADEGPRRPWRRFGARGRFKPWIRRTAHVTVVLSERQAAAPAGARAGSEDEARSARRGRSRARRQESE